MTAVQSMFTCLDARLSWLAYGEFFLLTMRLFRFPVVRTAFSRAQTTISCSNQRLRRIGCCGGKGSRLREHLAQQLHMGFEALSLMRYALPGGALVQ